MGGLREDMALLSNFRGSTEDKFDVWWHESYQRISACPPSLYRPRKSRP